MTEKLDLSLPERKAEAKGRPLRALIFINIVILLAVGAHIAMTVFRAGGTPTATKAAFLSPESTKKLALKLEKQGLNKAAAALWKEYLPVSSSDAKEAARIWYRIGKLYQQEGLDDKALESYYRSESFASLKEISSEISMRIQECLEGLGKFSALRYELQDRVGMKTGGAGKESGAAGEQVVAEIGRQKITKASLDRRIETQIDRQLSQLSSYLTDTQRKEQKERLLKEFSTSSQRRNLLNRFIMEELLYREALESNLMDDPEVRAELKDQERAMLAGKMIEKRLEAKINITPGDLKTWYEAHKKEYIRPERAKISHILVTDTKTAEEVRRRLKAGEAFAHVAASLSFDPATKENGGEIKGWIERKENGFIPGIGNSDEAMQAVFSTDPGRICEKDIKTEKGIHIIKVREREKAYQRTFDEAKDEVFRELRSRKQAEVPEGLMNELKEKYNVVIHQSAFSGNASGGPVPQKPGKK